MKHLLAAALLTTAMVATAHADGITEFRIGVLGGENAQDRVTENQCIVDHVQEALGVPVKLYTPADYDGVIQGLLGGTIDFANLGASGYAKAYVTDPNAVEPLPSRRTRMGPTSTTRSASPAKTPASRRSKT